MALIINILLHLHMLAYAYAYALVKTSLKAALRTSELLFTLLSPPDTARMFPVTDQLTCHTTSPNFFKTCKCIATTHVWLSPRKGIYQEL